METNEEWCEKVAKTIDPEGTFLDECNSICKQRFGEDYKEEQLTLLN